MKITPYWKLVIQKIDGSGSFEQETCYAETEEGIRIKFNESLRRKIFVEDTKGNKRRAYFTDSENQKRYLEYRYVP
jgi:hypothetical protein